MSKGIIEEIKETFKSVVGVVGYHTENLANPTDNNSESENSESENEVNDNSDSNSDNEINVRAPRTGDTRLHTAIKNGDVDQVKDLIGKGADVTITNSHNCSPLHVALRHNLEIAKYLLENTNDLDIDQVDSYGCSSLKLAIQKKNIEIVKIMINEYEVSETSLTAARKVLEGKAYAKIKSDIEEILNAVDADKIAEQRDIIEEVNAVSDEEKEIKAVQIKTEDCSSDLDKDSAFGALPNTNDNSPDVGVLVGEQDESIGDHF